MGHTTSTKINLFCILTHIGFFNCLSYVLLDVLKFGFFIHHFLADASDMVLYKAMDWLIYLFI